MSNIGMQLQMKNGISIANNIPVKFDDKIVELGNISYDGVSGIITINKSGAYYVDWWVSIQSTLQIYTQFSIVTQDNKIIPGNSPNTKDEVSGNALIQVVNTPYTFKLVNTTNQTVYYSTKTPVKANLTVIESNNTTASTGLLNLVDGNTTGSVRSINNQNNYSMGLYAIAIGENTYATGKDSFAQGYLTTASGISSNAQGTKTIASEDSSHAEGRETIASGKNSHAEGWNTVANGLNSHAQGYLTTASGISSHAQGVETISSGEASHAEGSHTIASGEASHAEGSHTIASGKDSHAQGYKTTASGEASHSEGMQTIASGKYSHSEGYITIASGDMAHAEGEETSALGISTHAEGYRTMAIGPQSHAQGYRTMAIGNSSHAEGYQTTSAGEESHAEGYQTVAAGDASHVGGEFSRADARNSFAHGLNVSTNGVTGAFVIGKYGGPSASTISHSINQEYGFFVANGTDDSHRSLSATILSNGEGYATKWNIGGADYGEMFETYDGKSIEAGYFVTFETGNKIRIANTNDKYILGIISKTASIVGDSNELNWCGRYIKDEWGGNIYDERGNLQLNPDFDNTKAYIPRSKREEWVVVGLLGKLLVRDDGNCKVDEYCNVGDGGIAIPSDIGYRVIDRLGEKQILILFNETNYLEHIIKIQEENKYLNNEIEIIKEKLKTNNIY